MNILILGGAGFFGANLIQRCLLDSDNKVTVVDSLEPRLKSELKNIENLLSKINFIKGDIRDMELMGKVVQWQDAVINCAGQTSHPLSLEDPFFDTEVNCIGNITILEAVRKHNPKAKVLFASSSTVIGGGVSDVVTESHGEVPLDIYSANKCAAEKYYKIYHTVHDIPTLTLRFANLYGPYGKGFPEFGFINYFIWLAANNKVINIFGEGLQTRNVMYVEDAADLMYKSIFHDNLYGNTFFAVHKEHYSVKKIAEEIVSIFGKGKIIYKDWPDVRKRIEIGDVIISGAKLYYEMPWEPKYNIRQGLEKTKNFIEKMRITE